MNVEHLNNLAVENFREYLRIPSVQPDPDYSELTIFKFPRNKPKSGARDKIDNLFQNKCCKGIFLNTKVEY